jgi:phytoene dehydrogenase-like protein
LAADLVIVNADLPYSTDTLLRNNVSCDELVRYDWDERFEYSSGVVAFHWSVNTSCINLSTHNVFLVGGTRKGLEDSWKSVRESRAAKQRNEVQFQDPCNQFANQSFNFYVHRPTATDPTAAPENCDSIMILVPCPSLRRNETLSLLSRDDAITGYHGQFRDVYIRDIKEAVLSRLSVVDGLQDLREHILHEVVDTPASYADYYNLAAGTPFALVRRKPLRFDTQHYIFCPYTL